jgi:hypothetical protein
MENLLLSDVHDEDHDGQLTDDYLHQARRLFTPLAKDYRDDERKQLLDMRDAWLKMLDDLGLQDDENLRSVIIRFGSMILSDDHATLSDVRDYLGTMMVALSVTKIK